MDVIRASLLALPHAFQDLEKCLSASEQREQQLNDDYEEKSRLHAKEKSEHYTTKLQLTAAREMLQKKDKYLQQRESEFEKTSDDVRQIGTALTTSQRLVEDTKKASRDREAAVEQAKERDFERIRRLMSEGKERSLQIRKENEAGFGHGQ